MLDMIILQNFISEQIGYTTDTILPINSINVAAHKHKSGR